MAAPTDLFQSANPNLVHPLSSGAEQFNAPASTTLPGLGNASAQNNPWYRLALTALEQSYLNPGLQNIASTTAMAQDLGVIGEWSPGAVPVLSSNPQASGDLLTAFGATPQVTAGVSSDALTQGGSAGLRTTTALTSVISDTLLNYNFIILGDNTLSTANNLGSLNTTTSSYNFVGSSDTQDYYRFSFASASAFNLALTGLTADADVQLLNSSGAVIASSTRTINDESINMASLAAGDYYVRVYQYSGDTNYTLQLSNSSPSNLMSVETNAGTLSGTRVFSGAVNSSNTADVYRFALGTTASTFNATLTGMSNDADVRLIRDSNNNGVVDAGEVVVGSYRGSTASEWISQSLAAGNYLMQVYRYSGDTNYNLTISTGDWYSQYLSDASVIGEARAAYINDGSISRTDMIAIMRETRDDSTVNTTELADLRRVVSLFSMSDSVRNLSNKIVNGNVANTRSGIGNLFAGSSSTQLDRLIGKWFLGSDRPITASGTTYQYTSGSLFQGGISVGDINQGGVGDCYLMSSLGAFAHDRPAVIQNMFTDNGDGTFTVRFFNNGVTDYVTVDRFLPTYGDGTAVYAGWNGGANTESNNELWVALAEKAYAQLNESGWIGQDNTNSYAGISGGWMAPVMRQVTGVSAGSQAISSMTQAQLINLVNSSTPITAGFVSGGGFGVVNEHAYTITSYNPFTGRFHLNNPWGNTHADVSWNELVALSAQIEWSNV